LLTRVRQVISAITARITNEDKIFITRNLTDAEQGLFWGMNLPDQRHALNVAYTALQLAADRRDINITILIKSALLHDVGKVRGDVSTLDKILTVAAHKIAPAWAEKWGKPGRGSKLANLRHAFYIYFNHPARSGVMLRDIGTSPAIIAIVARHHKAPADSDPPELTILRLADNMH